MRKSFFSYLNKSELVIALVLAFLSVAFSLSGPILVGHIIDSFVSKTFKISNMLILMSCYVSANIGLYSLSRFTSSMAYRISYQLREDMIQELHLKEVRYFDTHSRGQISYHFINDAEAVSEGLLNSLMLGFQALITIILSMIFMVYINGRLSLLVLAFTPVSILVSRFMAKHSQKSFEENIRQQARFNGMVEEHVSAYPMIAAYQYQEKAKAKFKALNHELYHTGFKSQYMASLSNPSTRAINNLLYAIVGIWGSLQVIQGSLSLGGLSSFLIYAGMFGKPFNDVTSVMPQIQNATASFRKIQDFLMIPHEKDKGILSLPKIIRGEIEFEKVDFGYDEKRLIFKQLSLKARPGQKIAIVGRTGAGKSTLMNVLLGFYPIQSGTVKLDGISINDLRLSELRSAFGFVPQNSWLFEGSIRDNIAYGKADASFEEVEALSKQLGIDDFIRQLDQGYDTLIQANGSNLSEGQRQLLTIARVMLANPPMVILDEATSYIDTYSELSIQKALNTLTKDRTSFVIAHRLSSIVDADEILVMEQGQVIERGTHQELLAAKGSYAILYQSQFKTKK